MTAHLIEDPALLQEMLKRGMPYAWSLCGMASRAVDLVEDPRICTCPRCLNVAYPESNSDDDLDVDSQDERDDDVEDGDLEHDPMQAISGMLNGLVEEDLGDLPGWQSVLESLEGIDESDFSFLQGLCNMSSLIGADQVGDRLMLVVSRLIEVDPEDPPEEDVEEDASQEEA